MNHVVTIGIPVFNVEPYIEQSLLSALEQDFTLPYEILVVDDCGTDRSMDIVYRLASNHPNGARIRVISHRFNKGVAQARNTILNNASGKYLFFLDSDDWMEESTLTLLHTKAIETGADITAGSSWYTQDDGPRYPYKQYPDCTVVADNAGVYYYLKKSINIRGELWGKLWLIEFLKSNDCVFIYPFIEDYIPDFITLVESHVVCLLSDYVYNYRHNRPGSIMTSAQEQRVIEKIFCWASIINTMQALIINRYSNVPGIYDLYLSKLRNALREITLLNKETTSFVNDRIKYSLSIIPSLYHIKKANNRLMYLLLRKDCSIERFIKYDTAIVHIAEAARKIRKSRKD